jgi:hypothetical protein
MLVFGTRPEAIKMCPLVKQLGGRPDEFEAVVCVTGQHKEMLRQVLDAFGVVPDHDLRVMRPGQTLFDITTGVLNGVRPILESERPDAVLVFIEPPSMEELERRLRSRGTEDEESIVLRLANARHEMELAARYDARIVNDDLATAVRETIALIDKYETDGGIDQDGSH